jgi:hypothetical protein
MTIRIPSRCLRTEPCPRRGYIGVRLTGPGHWYVFAVWAVVILWERLLWALKKER